VVGCSNNESRRLPDPQPKSTWKCTFTMRNLIIFINKGQEDEGGFTSVVACSSLICWTTNSTLCFDNGGLNKAFSILSSNGSVTCKTFTEKSTEQLSAKMFKNIYMRCSLIQKGCLNKIIKLGGSPLDTLESSCENSEAAASIPTLGGSSAIKHAA
jgi:hypothetical protein